MAVQWTLGTRIKVLARKNRRETPMCDMEQWKGHFHIQSQSQRCWFTVKERSTHTRHHEESDFKPSSLCVQSNWFCCSIFYQGENRYAKIIAERIPLGSIASHGNSQKVESVVPGNGWTEQYIIPKMPLLHVLIFNGRMVITSAASLKKLRIPS